MPFTGESTGSQSRPSEQAGESPQGELRNRDRDGPARNEVAHRTRRVSGSAAGSFPGKPGRARRALRGVMIIMAILILISAIRLMSSALSVSSGEPLPVMAQIPGFSLTQRNNQTVTHDDLKGYIWVADFIFTTCAGPCPELTLRMRSLQKSLIDRREDVKLVTFTLDASYDTPKVLRAYANRNHADPEFWWFLTGNDEPAIHKLVAEGFLQTVVAASEDSPIIHSTYFVLVDRKGLIRGFYDGLDAASKPRMLRDIDTLLREPYGP